jgi:DNA-binding MarR family transcriptional regulator
MSRPELLLDNQLCFLVYRLDRAIQARYRPLLDELGITYPQYLVLLALWEHASLGIGQLCELLDLDTGTVSPLVKRMESRGLVKRERSSEDERAVSVSLTPEGRALEARATAVPGALASCLLRDYAEYGKVKASLRELVERMDCAKV